MYSRAGVVSFVKKCARSQNMLTNHQKPQKISPPWKIKESTESGKNEDWGSKGTGLPHRLQNRFTFETKLWNGRMRTERFARAKSEFEAGTDLTNIPNRLWILCSNFLSEERFVVCDEFRSLKPRTIQWNTQIPFQLPSFHESFLYTPRSTPHRSDIPDAPLHARGAPLEQKFSQKQDKEQLWLISKRILSQLLTFFEFVFLFCGFAIWCIGVPSHLLRQNRKRTGFSKNDGTQLSWNSNLLCCFHSPCSLSKSLKSSRNKNCSLCSTRFDKSGSLPAVLPSAVPNVAHLTSIVLFFPCWIFSAIVSLLPGQCSEDWKLNPSQK